MKGYLLALVATSMAAALMVLWVLAMRRVNMGERLPILNSLAAAATIFGVASLALESGILGGLLAGSSVFIGAVFLVLGVFLSAMSRQEPAVKVGAPLISFTAPDENGEPFEIESLRGSPVLLKFFRGHW